MLSFSFQREMSLKFLTLKIEIHQILENITSKQKKSHPLQENEKNVI